MIAEVIRERMLVNGERLHVRHRNSLAYRSTMVGDRRVFSPYVVVVQADGESVSTRSISAPLILQVIDEHRS